MPVEVEVGLSVSLSVVDVEVSLEVEVVVSLLLVSLLPDEVLDSLEVEEVVLDEVSSSSGLESSNLMLCQSPEVSE